MTRNDVISAEVSLWNYQTRTRTDSRKTGFKIVIWRLSGHRYINTKLPIKPTLI